MSRQAQGLQGRWWAACGTALALGAVLLAGLALGGTESAAAPDKKAEQRAKFALRKKAILIEAGTARAKLGTWCRDAGLVAQATATFLKAVEESDGQNSWAVRIVDLMRRLDDKFWKSVRRRPGKVLLDSCEKKDRRLDEDRQETLFKLASDGHKAELTEEALEVWGDLIRETDQPLVFDAEGRVVLAAGNIPADASAKIKASAITINDRPYLRDDFLELVPQVKELREANGPRVRVRMQGTAGAPDDLRASLEALLPFLEEDVGGRPTNRMTVFVFQDKANWGVWLGAAKLPQFTSATGLADGATKTAIVCAENLDAEALRGVCLHEMSHLFMYGVTPVVMPSWYSEGFAETYGGEGTYTWKDGKLTAGGKMTERELAPLKTPEGYIPLLDLLGGDALNLLTKDPGMGRRFYTESWALLRWFRTAASPDLQERFGIWETACRGAALGAQAGKPREQDTSPSTSEFLRRRADHEAGDRLTRWRCAHSVGGGSSNRAATSASSPVRRSSA